MFASDSSKAGLYADSVYQPKDITSVLWSHGREYVTTHIRLAIALHGVKKLFLMDHENCGAVAGVYGPFQSKADEMKVHRNNMEKAREDIIGMFPELEVYCYFEKLDGSVVDMLE